MKKLLLVTVALMLLGSVAWGQHQGGTISGTVMGQDEGGAIPLRFAAVSAYQANNQWPTNVVVTDSMGQYEMRVPYGRYVIRAEAMHYVSLWYDNVRDRSQATVIIVDSLTNPTGIDFLLPEQGPPPGMGTISGVVMGQHDTTTVPIPANVYAFTPNGDRPVSMTQTDRSGNYTLHLPFGDYQIRAESYHFVALWYNNVPERDQATTVTVDSMTNPTGIDFLLPEQGPPPPPPGRGTISGVVMGQHDTVAVPLVAAVFAYAPNSAWPANMTVTDRSGNYTLRVPFGNYVIKAEAFHFVSLWYDNVPERSQATIITVDSTNNPTGIDFLLPEQGPPPPPPPPARGISGTVTDAATTEPIAGAMVTAVDVNNHWIHFAATTHEDGTYLLGTRPGEYIVQAHARDYNQAEYPTHVVVPESTIVEDINFALTAIDFGSIAGMVTDTTGAGVPGAFVEARMLGRPLVLHARTDSTGAYILEHVIPGFYRLRAYHRGYAPGAYPDSVAVADGQNVTGIDIVLGVIPPPFNGTIGGTVTDDSTGDPVGHAVVVAVGGDRWHPRFRYAFTNDDGTYLLDGLAQVPYKVFSAARGYIGEFYDNVTNIHDATPVTPNADGINFALTPGINGYRSFGGYVSAPEGLIVEGAVVYAMVDGQIIGATTTDPDGYYVLDGIEPGTYDVSVASIYGDGGLGRPLDIALIDIPDADIQIGATSAGDDTAPIPTVSSLAQNYPNPFNARTVISFNLATAGQVELDIYNMIGQKVATLIDGNYNPGIYEVIWDGSNVSSGVYYYRLVTSDRTETKKMTLLK
jgi:hypothetical protein